jgi:hypothetical protein
MLRRALKLQRINANWEAIFASLNLDRNQPSAASNQRSTTSGARTCSCLISPSACSKTAAGAQSPPSPPPTKSPRFAAAIRFAKHDHCTTAETSKVETRRLWDVSKSKVDSPKKPRKNPLAHLQRMRQRTFRSILNFLCSSPYPPTCERHANITNASGPVDDSN